MTKKSKLNSLSVFYPCFNEQENIQIFIQEALDFLPSITEKFEVIVVNDGSRDDTKKVLKELSEHDSRVRIINHQKNKGYGAALKSGFSAAKYDWVFFTDGDLQFKIKQLGKFVPYTSEYQAVIGFRENRADGKLRSIYAFLFKLYIDLLFRVHVKDIDCAFKLFKVSAVRSVNLVSTGAFTSAELLYKLKKKGVVFKQLPVLHYKRKFGTPTGNHPRVIIKAGIEALRLYLRIKWESLKK